MSLALDVSPLLLHVHCGRVCRLTQEGRCWQDEDRFSNVCALSVKADVLTVHSQKHTLTHTYMAIQCLGILPTALLSVICYQQKTGKVKYLVWSIFKQVQDVFPGSTFMGEFVSVRPDRISVYFTLVYWLEGGCEKICNLMSPSVLLELIFRWLNNKHLWFIWRTSHTTWPSTLHLLLIHYCDLQSSG